MQDGLSSEPSEKDELAITERKAEEPMSIFHFNVFHLFLSCCHNCALWGFGVLGFWGF